MSIVIFHKHIMKKIWVFIKPTIYHPKGPSATLTDGPHPLPSLANLSSSVDHGMTNVSLKLTTVIALMKPIPAGQIIFNSWESKGGIGQGIPKFPWSYLTVWVRGGGILFHRFWQKLNLKPASRLLKKEQTVLVIWSWRKGPSTQVMVSVCVQFQRLMTSACWVVSLCYRISSQYLVSPLKTKAWHTDLFWGLTRLISNKPTPILQNYKLISVIKYIPAPVFTCSCPIKSTILNKKHVQQTTISVPKEMLFW